MSTEIAGRHLRNDLTGKEIGDFIVERFDESSPKYKYRWICKCKNCGKERSYESSRLMMYISKGRELRCKCNTNFGKRTELKGYRIDYSGQKFGHITVKSFAYQKASHSWWNCVCECGNECVIGYQSLMRDKNVCCQSCFKKYHHQAPKKQNTYEYMDGYVLINGKVMIDQGDVDKIKELRNYVTISNGGYAYVKVDGQQVFLNRYLMNLSTRYNEEDSLVVDHINGNRLDNRRNNLRVIVKDKNPINCKVYSNNKSGHKGISWKAPINKWQVNLQYNGDNHYLGVYSDFNEAVKVREEAKKKYFGDINRGSEHLRG